MDETPQHSSEAIAGAAPETADGTAGGSPGPRRRKPRRRRSRARKTKPTAGTTAESAAVTALRAARQDRRPVEGKVIGWNKGGFHVAVGELYAFCPRSEMEPGPPAAPESYLDRTFSFQVLRVQEAGRRIVLSRAAAFRADRWRAAEEVKKGLASGAVVEGTVSSLVDFGAFIDLGAGVEGLIHVSELSRTPVGQPGDLLSPGQQVAVKVLTVEAEGERISLSLKALEADPWEGIRARYREGTLVTGTVEGHARFGVFVRLEPGVTGLLPASEISLPRGSTAARAYPSGKQVRLQVLSVDPRKRRISLAPEGAQAEGSHGDYKAFLDRQKKAAAADRFNALAAAFRKIEAPEER